MDEDKSWVFESLVGLLGGPVWNIPILTFIEQKSLIFEPDCDDSEDYRKIHNEYKNLVDFMLGTYMEDLGITPEQFEDACGKASKNVRSQFHHSLFEQIWAAEDYEIFKRMMIQKNIELQLQALELLQQRYGIVPQSMVSGSEVSNDEEAIMEKVIKRSLEEHEQLLKGMDSETKELEKNIATTAVEKKRLETEIQREKELLEKAMNLNLQDSDNANKNKTSAPVSPYQDEPQQTDPQEIARRQAYLRQQRDKLLSLKKDEREKQLQQMDNGSQKRPKSARAAKKVLDTQKAESTIDPKTLAARQALVARLKAEVIGSH